MAARIAAAGDHTKQPGMLLPTPPTTGPTGTNGGAKIGTGPAPKTFCTKVLVLNKVNTVYKALAKAANKWPQCAAL